MNLDDLNKVWEVKPLKMAREGEAREILEKVAKQVQPIMRKRKWKVKILSEFWPTNPALLGLNVNGGEEVKVRLRRPNNEWDFFPYEQILDTMLHELCHNQYGPHNADFYNLLDEIRKECEELMAKGITGSGKGFDLRGKRLGGFTRQPLLPSLRLKALSAAENRAQRGTQSGPKRLGGDSSLRDVLTPIQAAAMAAERRLHDDLWCASQADEASEAPPFSQQASSREALPSTSVTSHGEGEPKPSWQCGVCTLLNEPLNVSCEACGTQRIEDKNVKKTTKTSMKIWSCKFCTLQNSMATERCVACGEWKYSYGPPTATRGPYLGTEIKRLFRRLRYSRLVLDGGE